MPFRQWMSARAAILAGRSPAAWIGSDSEDLPLAEAWREATGASAASLGRVFPELAEAASPGVRTVRDASLLIVARAARDMERTGIGPLAEVLQRNFEAITSSTTIAARVLADVTTSEAIRGFADTASRLADLGGVANVGGPTQSAAWAGFADLAAASSVQRMATLGLLDGMRPYESLLSEMASS